MMAGRLGAGKLGGWGLGAGKLGGWGLGGWGLYNKKTPGM